MKELKEIWGEVCHKQKGLMVVMILLIILSGILLFFSLTALRPQSTVVISGYGDVYGEIAGISGGYRRESWMNMLAYPILSVLFGVIHNIIVLRVYRKYGSTPAMMVALLTMLLVAATFVVLVRLIGEW